MAETTNTLKGIVGLIMLVALLPFLLELLNITYGFPILISTGLASRIIEFLVVLFIIAAFVTMIKEGLGL